MAKIGILGAGTWGTALAKTLVSHNEVTLWSALPAEIESLDKHRVHPNLPGMAVPAELQLTTELGCAITGMDVVVFAVASPYTRQTAAAAAQFIKEDQILVDVAKGLEPNTHMTLTEVIADALGMPGIPLVALSGPTHAEEVALEMPTTIVAASADIRVAESIQQMFSNEVLRVYTNTDIKGVEICGAMKNIIALAAGVSDGLGYGDNAKAALITRGMMEITRLGTAMGGRKETFTSLAGIGDLIVTCTSKHSRNNRTGVMIGQGVSPEDAVREIGMVVEGINALPAAMELSAQYGVELPICEMVKNVLSGEIAASDAIKYFMARDLKPEYV